MKKIKICLLDGVLDKNILGELIDYTDVQLNVVQDEISQKASLHINHAALCLSLLIEEIRLMRIQDKVEITYLSATNEDGSLSLNRLLSSLEYCQSQEFDIISMSLGVIKRSKGKQIFSCIEKIKKAILVAAASNDFSLTYPAAFQQVLGVKRGKQKTSYYIDRIYNPYDGIEVVANLPANTVVKRIEKKFYFPCHESNSLLAPRISGIIAYHILSNSGFLSKDILLTKMATSSRFALQDDCELLSQDELPLDEQTPIVLLPYTANCEKSRISRVLIKVQHAMEQLGYSCAIICDWLSISDYVSGWYRLEIGFSQQMITYYQKNCFGQHLSCVAKC